MDPNILSMEQGKQLLKQIGIPQRDIDMMTEKWMVVASVEVMLRFPLKPGENLEAHCISSKMPQVSVGQSHTLSPRNRDQEERKPINQCLKKIIQRLKDSRNTANHGTQQQSHTAHDIQSPKMGGKGPMRPGAPKAETADTGVKCKNCGAFGHTMSSKTCPMKHWAGAIAVQPLGSNKEKENLKPKSLQEPSVQESFNKIVTQKKKWEIQDQQKKPTTQNILCERQKKQNMNYNDLEESCDHLRVKCKNCGAFGHTVSSKTCPMKHWVGAIAVQPLGSNKEKENLKPKSLQEPSVQESFNKIVTQKKKWEIQDQQKKPTTQNILCERQKKQNMNYNDLEESCDHLRVKCKNCGAFGHTMRSKTCPMKHWAGAIAVQPLGSNKEKENLKPKSLQEPSVQESFNKIVTQEEKREIQEQQKNHQTQNTPCERQKQSMNYKDLEESCDYLRRPTRPMPVYQTKKHTASASVLTSVPPGKPSGKTSICATDSVITQPGLSPFLSPQGSGKTCEVAFTKALPSSSKASTLIGKKTKKKSHTLPLEVPQFQNEKQILSHTFHVQAQSKCPVVRPKSNLQPAVPSVTQKSKGSLRAPGKRLSQMPVRISKKSRLGLLHKSQANPPKTSAHLATTVQPPTNTNRPGLKEVLPGTAAPPPVAPHRRPHLPATQTHVIFPPGKSNHVLDQALGKIPTTLNNGQLSSKFSIAPTSVLPKKSTADQDPHVLQDSQQHCLHVPKSVLYEDLLVSSSDENDIE